MRISGTSVCVDDQGKARKFYTEILGFEVVERSDSGDAFDWVWLRRNGAHIMLNTQYEADQRPEERDPVRDSAHGDTGLFFSCPDVDGAYRHLLDHGLDVEPPVDRVYGMRQVYVLDPDGYTLCFQWPVESHEES